MEPIKQLQKFTSLTLVLAAITSALVLSGCNTMEGVGEDTEAVGEEIQEGAN